MKTLEEAWSDFIQAPHWTPEVRAYQIAAVQFGFKAGFAVGRPEGDVAAQVEAWAQVCDLLLAYNPMMFAVGITGRESVIAEITKIAKAFYLTPGQRALMSKHGSPEQFTDAVINAIGEISVAEAQEAIAKYRKEWEDA